jgi:serine/threonine-protein kinase
LRISWGFRLSSQSIPKPLGSQYLTFEMIGRGAMGTVYRGEVRETGEPIAAKILHADLASDPTVVARFLRERDILTKLNHPNIVQVRDFVIEQDKIAFIMELVQGSNLRERLKNEGRISQRQAFSFISQVCKALAIASSLGVVHRDIKPENILLDSLTSLPTVKITDFGISRILGMDNLTRVSSTLGTPEYMAPELFDAELPTPAVDVYAAGITLYELLTGATPFAAGSPMMVMRKMLQTEPEPIRGLDESAWNLISSMLSKSPEDRPQDVNALGLALERTAKSVPDEKLSRSVLTDGTIVGTTTELKVASIEPESDVDTTTRLSIPKQSTIEIAVEKKSRRQNWESEFKKLRDFKESAGTKKVIKEEVVSSPAVALLTSLKSEKVKSTRSRRLIPIFGFGGLAVAAIVGIAIFFSGHAPSKNSQSAASISHLASPSPTVSAKPKPTSIKKSSTPTPSLHKSPASVISPTPIKTVTNSASAKPTPHKSTGIVAANSPLSTLINVLSITLPQCKTSDGVGNSSCPNISTAIPADTTLISWQLASPSIGTISQGKLTLSSQIMGTMNIKVSDSTGQVQIIKRSFHYILIVNPTKASIHWVYIS